MAGFEATRTPLGANETYTSATLMADTYDTIVGTVFADQAGTLYIEQSNNGTNWDLSTSNSISASTGEAISEVIVAPYFRARYVNGATPQTAFRLTVKRSAAGVKG